MAAPYAAAVMEAMGLTVDRLDSADLTPTSGDYDVIICEGAVHKAPGSWLAGLAPGGRLAVVERDDVQGRGMLYSRSGDGTGVRAPFCAPPPFMAGGWPPPRVPLP